MGYPCYRISEELRQAELKLSEVRERAARELATLTAKCAQLQASTARWVVWTVAGQYSQVSGVCSCRPVQPSEWCVQLQASTARWVVCAAAGQYSQVSCVPRKACCKMLPTKWNDIILLQQEKKIWKKFLNSIILETLLYMNDKGACYIYSWVTFFYNVKYK